MPPADEDDEDDQLFSDETQVMLPSHPYTRDGGRSIWTRFRDWLESAWQSLSSSSITQNLKRFLMLEANLCFGMGPRIKIIYIVIFMLLLGLVFGLRTLIISLIMIALLYCCVAAQNFGQGFAQSRAAGHGEGASASGVGLGQQQQRAAGGATGNIRTIRDFSSGDTQ